MSKHFVDDNVFLDKEYVGQYGPRLRELDLPAAWENDYGVYAYEPAKGMEPATYWVCRQVIDRCPVCNARYKTDAVASVSESKLTHYCRVKVNLLNEKPHYELRPATIYLRRVRWRCYNCYAQSGNYNARMEDDSRLVYRNETLTLPLKEQLGRWGLYMTTASLARIFNISEPVIKKCITKELAACDKKRKWDDIRTLGLYTVELNVQKEKVPCCLCTDVDNQSLIELFAYEDKKAAANFLRSIKNKQNIHQVLTSVDDAACSFAEQNFPDAEIMVDRVDIRKRLLYGLETCMQGNEDSPNFPLLRRHWDLLDSVDAISPDSKDSFFLSSVLAAFPRIAAAYQLKEAGLDIYRAETGQSQLIDNWIFSDKHGIFPYEQLEQRMVLEKTPVLRFAVRYNGAVRHPYEEDILSVEKPLLRYTNLLCSESSALGSHAASMQMVRARVLYGAAMMANFLAKRYKTNAEQDKANAAYYTAYMSKFTFRPNIVKQSPKAEPEIALYNFGIPLGIYPVLLRDGLTEYRGSLLDLPPLKGKNNEVKKMPRKMSAGVDDTSKMRDVETYTHDDKKRTNNPPVGMAQHDKAEEKVKTYQYDPHLDPTLQWAGKAEGTSFEVPTSSIHIHESIKPLNIISRVTKEYSKALEGQMEGQLSMFAAETPAERMRRRRESIEFYQHGVDWTNRMIAGDSLVIMNSLIEKEGLSGGVQMVYIDPPYGIKYGSNFQPFVDKRDVKDKKDEDLSQEPEMIKAFRDTWELGIHSYLSYLRDRLLLARELLADTGSVFVQISDENVHHVREICDEVFGAQNFVRLIAFQKTGGKSGNVLSCTVDYLVWYAKDIQQIKYHQLYTKRIAGDTSLERYDMLMLPNGKSRRITPEERLSGEIPSGAKRYQLAPLYSDGAGSDFPEFEFEGKKYKPRADTHWKTTVDGLQRLAEKNRIEVMGNVIRYRRYVDDFPVIPITDRWDSMQSGVLRLYVVQTATSVVSRCLLMTTDPGDLVLDITCGSGTTAYVAEQWGRRWITCDTSRVAITLAKQRLMTATFDYYKLAHEEQGVGSGFVYKTVPHITLKSIANNEPPAQEILYDQPEIDKTKIRVTGPFTVEALPAPVVKPLDDVLAGDEDISAKQTDWRDQLLATGILGRGGARLEFSRVEPLQGTRYLQAVAETKEDPPRRAVICFAGETKPLDSRMVALALDEAQMQRPTPQLIIFAAFQFDPEAAKDIDNTNWPGMVLLKAQMNTDLMTEDLKKKRSSDQSFWLVGQPDVELIHDKRTKDKYKVKVNGFDYYDVKKGTVESGSTSRIAMWMLDTDYDGMCIEPDMVFFPMGGKKDGWNKLAKTLRTEINMDLIDKYAGSESLWFTAQPNTAIAVKIIDDRGIESLKVIRVGDE